MQPDRTTAGGRGVVCLRSPAVILVCVHVFVDKIPRLDLKRSHGLAFRLSFICHPRSSIKNVKDRLFVIEDPVSLFFTDEVKSNDPGSPIGVGDDRKRQRIVSTPVLSLSKEITEHIQSSTLLIGHPVSLLVSLPCVSFVQAKDPGSSINNVEDDKLGNPASWPLSSSPFCHPRPLLPSCPTPIGHPGSWLLFLSFSLIRKTNNPGSSPSIRVKGRLPQG